MILFKNFSVILTALITVTIILIGTHFRLYPLTFNTTNDAFEKASLIVISQLRQTVKEHIDTQLPLLPPEQKLLVYKREFDRLLHQKGSQAGKKIQQLAVEIDQKEGKKAPFYLLESDSFNYYNLTENILKTGQLSDETKGSKYLNKLMMAPAGFYEPLNWHPYVGFYIYKIIQFFNPSAELMWAVSWTPIVMSALSCILFILLCRNLQCSLLSQTIGGIFFILTPIYLKRSCFGWYDNDPYIIFFSLLILLCFFRTLDALASVKKRILFGLMTAISMATYTLFWQGWMYLFSVLFLSILVGMGYLFFVKKDNENFRALASTSGWIFLMSFIGIALAFGWQDFFILFKEGLKALREFLNPPLSLWPDMYVSVGELKKSNLKEFLEFTNGPLGLGLAGLGTVFGFLRLFRKPSTQETLKIIVLGLCLMSSLLLTLGAQRFALLSVVPLGIFLTMAVERMLEWRGALLGRQEFRAKKRPLFILFISLNLLFCILLLSLSFIPIRYAYDNTLNLLNRLYNDTWHHVLTQIKQQTPQDSIINTWWPPGHFIKAMANRRVTFDGATINKPQAYWMSNALLTDNETASLGLLRMLNNSSNSAVDYLESTGMTLSQSIELLKTITQLNEATAQSYLSSFLNPQQIDALLTLTHASPPASYVLIYNELVEKNLVLSFVDRWDFTKMERLKEDPLQRKKIPPKNSKAYIDFLWETAHGPLRYSGALTEISRAGKEILFDKGIKINIEEKTCVINSPEFGKGVPQYLTLSANEKTVHHPIPHATLPYSVVLYQEDSLRYNCILMDHRLARSILVQLYFFNGQGLRFFKPFIKEHNLTKRTQIVVFKIDWADSSLILQ